MPAAATSATTPSEKPRSGAAAGLAVVIEKDRRRREVRLGDRPDAVVGLDRPQLESGQADAVPQFRGGGLEPGHVAAIM